MTTETEIEIESSKSFDEPQIITIDLDEYEQLRASARFLMALKAAGLDNWEGLGQAQTYDKLLADFGKSN